MVIVMQEGASDAQIQHVIDRLIASGFNVHRSTGESHTVLGAVGVHRDFDHRDFELLDGVRGAPPADRAALAKLMATLSRFAADHADLIEEVDLNPVIVHPEGQGITVVDALIVKRRL